MNINEIPTAQLSAAIDFLAFFLVAPELLGEKGLRIIRKGSVFFFFFVNLFFLIAITLFFVGFVALLPILVYRYSVIYSYLAGDMVQGGGLFVRGRVLGVYFLLAPFSPLLFIVFSYLPTLITNLLETLENEKKLRQFLIRTGVLLFVAGKVMDFIAS